MDEVPSTLNSCKQYLGREPVNNENQPWNLGKSIGSGSGLSSMKQPNSGNTGSIPTNLGGQATLFTSHFASQGGITRINLDFPEETQEMSLKTRVSQKGKQPEIISSGYVTPRTEYVSPPLDIPSSGENYGFHSNQPHEMSSPFLGFGALKQHSAMDAGCRGFVGNSFEIPEMGIVPIGGQTTVEAKTSSPSVSRMDQSYSFGTMTTQERIYSEYRAATEKELPVYNLDANSGDSTTIQVCQDSCVREDAISANYNYGTYYGVSAQVQPCIGSSQDSQPYMYGTFDLNRAGEANGVRQTVSEFTNFAVSSNYPCVPIGAPESRFSHKVPHTNIHGAEGVPGCYQDIGGLAENGCAYYSYCENSTPPSSHLSSQPIQNNVSRTVDLGPEKDASHFRMDRAADFQEGFVQQDLVHTPGLATFHPPIPPCPPGLATPPHAPIFSGVNGFQGSSGCPVGSTNFENVGEYCVRKRKRPGTAGNDRNFYIVDFICEIPINIKDLFMKVIRDSAEGSRILRDFSMGSLAMRRSGNVAPTVIKCFFHSYRDGISRLQCKSKRYEGRPFLFVINETKLSRPWVFCPNVKCIRRAKSSGKLKGRIKVYEYCPGSDRIILSPTFLKCARGFLTSDYYFCATLCPQQKYADHESNFWGEDFSTGFGGNLIQETLTNDTENGGSGITLVDYILFCNSKHQFVATFRRFPFGGRPWAPPVKNSYVNASSPDEIFGDEIELSLVNIMTTVIRSLEGSKEPTIYAPTDKFIQEASLSSEVMRAQTNSGRFGIQTTQPVPGGEFSFGPVSSGSFVPVDSDEARAGTLRACASQGSSGFTLTESWSDPLNPPSGFHNPHQRPEMGGRSSNSATGAQYVFNSEEFSMPGKDYRAPYVQHENLDFEDSHSSKFETYSTGYTDEDSFSTFNDSGAQLSLNFDPQDALVVESSTNWVLDVLLNKSSENQNFNQNTSHTPRSESLGHSENYSPCLSSFDDLKNPARSPGTNPSSSSSPNTGGGDDPDRENEGKPVGDTPGNPPLPEFMFDATTPFTLLELQDLNPSPTLVATRPSYLPEQSTVDTQTSPGPSMLSAEKRLVGNEF
ncbi:hypothetical protein HWI79_2485 [Cryptosporidium felis]|nr:hypothetical protein HWI79_2485 [Cryptosporidium felis]